VLCLIFPAPTWNDIVDLALIELRQFGATSIQVARRMEAMLEHLIDRHPEARAAALKRGLSALEASIACSLVDAEDRRRADLAGFQALGVPRRGL